MPDKPLFKVIAFCRNRVLFGHLKEVELISVSSINSWGVKGLFYAPVDCDSDTKMCSFPTTVVEVGQWSLVIWNYNLIVDILGLLKELDVSCR